jgi:hypothetical protein
VANEGKVATLPEPQPPLSPSPNRPRSDPGAPPASAPPRSSHSMEILKPRPGLAQSFHDRRRLVRRKPAATPPVADPDRPLQRGFGTATEPERDRADRHRGHRHPLDHRRDIGAMNVTLSSDQTGRIIAVCSSSRWPRSSRLGSWCPRPSSSIRCRHKPVLASRSDLGCPENLRQNPRNLDIRSMGGLRPNTRKFDGLDDIFQLEGAWVPENHGLENAGSVCHAGANITGGVP